MRIAIIASEATPFAKTGGLGDVVAALPKTLFRLGHQPILIMPLHRSVREARIPLATTTHVKVPVGAEIVSARVLEGRIPGTEAYAYFLEHDAFFDREALYGTDDGDYTDNCARYAFLSRGALEVLRALEFHPDVIHIHDWQASLVAPYRKILYKNYPLFEGTGILLTIHNMAHQGIFWHWDMETIGLDWAYFNWKQLEFWGKINLLKAGIVFSDVINTVSPTYAREIETRLHGQGLEGALRDRDAVLHGVVNGIDEALWNPATDTHLVTTYVPEDMAGKASCKRALQRQCKLPQQGKTPLLGVVSRFAEQKGLDLVAKALPDLFDEEPLQCVILGDGHDEIETMLLSVAKQYPKRLAVFARYDDRLAHRIIAGADAVLAPSRFEPCGLTQLYGLKYGSVPIVRSTGGLADTVCDCTPETLAAGRASGFTFMETTPDALAQCIRRATALYRDSKSWQRLVQIGMAQDWSWEASARRYLELYAEAREETLGKTDAKGAKAIQR